MQLPDLPIQNVLPEIRTVLSKGSAVLTAPPGSGKTTVVPLALLEEDWLNRKKIIVLQPRRIAARATCQRMADLAREPVGQTIGYHIRHDKKVSPATRIEVVTEGILTRRLQNNPDLEDVGLIVFDEFHERSIHSDLALALVLDLLPLNENLRILIMSATLDAEPVAQLLGGVPIINAVGSNFPVKIEYLKRINDLPLPHLTAQHVTQVLAKESGDILVFLPGIGSIRATEKILRDIVDPATLIQSLYGNLPQTKQNKILYPRDNTGKRVILSTSLAETSLTIEGITAVVDSGWCRKPIYNPANGLSALQTMRVSKSSADQRAGRAGRLGPGYCLRLWNETTHHSLPEFHPPEIVNADLSSLVLQILHWGVTDPYELQWLDPPRKSNYKKAISLLGRLGAVDAKGKITQLGQYLAQLPLHPRLGLLLVKSYEAGDTDLGATLCALLSERDPLRNEAASGAEISLRLELLQGFIKQGNRSTAHKLGISGTCRQIEKSARNFKKHTIKSIKGSETTSLSMILSHAYPDRIAQRVSMEQRSYLLANGRRAKLKPSDPLLHSEYLVVAEVDSGSREGSIHLAEPVDILELQNEMSHLVSTTQHIAWDRDAGRVKAVEINCLGAITVTKRPLTEIDSDLIAEALAGAIQESGLKLLPWTGKAMQLQKRVALLREYLGSIGWPDFETEALNQNLDWLTPFLVNMHTRDHLSGLNLYEILHARLDYKQQKALQDHAPEMYQVPTGSKIRLDYSQPGQVILSVRLQEILGLQQHPTICSGKVRLVIHLLSPANRPIQITGDLVNFWNTSYVEVKKDLKGRYPKHYWPDNPMEAVATKTTKRKMNIKP